MRLDLVEQGDSASDFSSDSSQVQASSSSSRPLAAGACGWSFAASNIRVSVLCSLSWTSQGNLAVRIINQVVRGASLERPPQPFCIACQDLLGNEYLAIGPEGDRFLRPDPDPLQIVFGLQVGWRRRFGVGDGSSGRVGLQILIPLLERGLGDVTRGLDGAPPLSSRRRSSSDGLVMRGPRFARTAGRTVEPAAPPIGLAAAGFGRMRGLHTPRPGGQFYGAGARFGVG